MNKYWFFVIIVILVTACKEDERNKSNKTEKEEYTLVLRNGNVIDIETGEIKKQDIFIIQDKIVKIEAVGENKNYTASKSINVEGKYVLPGFWDNHVHFRGRDSLIEANKSCLKLFIQNGITTVRDAGGDLTASVLEWTEQIEQNELVGPTIFTSGPKIDGPDARWAGSLEVETAGDIENALDSLQKIPVDFVKIYDSTISGESYLMTIEEASRRKLITSGHMPFTVTLEQTVDAGIGAVEHLYYILKGCSKEEQSITRDINNGKFGFWESMAKLIRTYDDSTASKTFRLLRENNVYVVPTLHIGDVLSTIPDVDHSKDYYLEFMSEGIIKTYEGRIKGAMNASAKAKKERKDLNLFFKSLIKSLSDANVGLLAGSDSGAYNSYLYPGISLHMELEAMVNAGLTTLQALQTSAYNGSKFLKKDLNNGTVGVGKVADLVILNRNPLEDITQTKNIKMVVKSGLEVDMTRIVIDSLYSD